MGGSHHTRIRSLMRSFLYNGLALLYEPSQLAGICVKFILDTVLDAKLIFQRNTDSILRASMHLCPDSDCKACGLSFRSFSKLTSAGIYFASFMQIITPFNIYYNIYFIFQKHEYWRLLTNFLYFGSFSELSLRFTLFHLQGCLLGIKSSFRAVQLQLVCM